MLPAKSKFNPELRRVAQMAKEAGMNEDQRRVLLSRQEVPPPNGYKYELPYTSGDVGFAEVMAEAGKNGKLKQTLFESLTFQGIPKIQAEDIRILAERLRCAREALEHRPQVELQNAYKVSLTESEIQSFNWAVRFFEEWFYRGKWAELSKPRSYARENAWADFFVPATLLNTMAKIKEQSLDVSRLKQINREKTDEFVGRVKGYAENVLKKASSSLKLFDSATELLVGDLEETYSNAEVGTRGSIWADDLYFMKVSLIAGEFARRDYCQAQAHNQVYEFDPESILVDLHGNPITTGNDLTEPDKICLQPIHEDFLYSMHYRRYELPFARVAFEYFRQQQNHKNNH